MILIVTYVIELQLVSHDFESFPLINEVSNATKSQHVIQKQIKINVCK